MIASDDHEIELVNKKEAAAGDAWSFDGVPTSEFDSSLNLQPEYSGTCVWYDKSYWSNYRAEPGHNANINIRNGSYKSQRELQHSRERWPLFDSLFTYQCNQ